MQNLRHVWLAGLLLLLGACGTVLGNEARQAREAQVASLPTVVLPTTVATTATKEDAATPTSVPALNAAACKFTRPPEPPFTAPTPYSASAPWTGMFWYGTNRLWTALPLGGRWSGLPRNSDGYGQKVLWWREGYLWNEDPTPQLIVTGRRLDAPAPPLHSHEATNAYAEDIGSAMLVGANFPTPGCWEVTGKVTDQELTFVVWVEP